MGEEDLEDVTIRKFLQDSMGLSIPGNLTICFVLSARFIEDSVQLYQDKSQGEQKVYHITKLFTCLYYLVIYSNKNACLALKYANLK